MVLFDPDWNIIVINVIVQKTSIGTDNPDWYHSGLAISFRHNSKDQVGIVAVLCTHPKNMNIY